MDAELTTEHLPPARYRLLLSRYWTDGAPRIRLLDIATDEVAMTATICPAQNGTRVRDGCVLVPDYGQHEGLALALIDAGLMSWTRRKVRTSPWRIVWELRMSDELVEAFKAAADV